MSTLDDDEVFSSSIVKDLIELARLKEVGEGNASDAAVAILAILKSIQSSKQLNTIPMMLSHMTAVAQHFNGDDVKALMLKMGVKYAEYEYLIKAVEEQIPFDRGLIEEF